MGSADAHRRALTAVTTPAEPAERRPRRVFRSASVVRTEQISPTFRRIVIAGPDLATFPTPRPAAHVKIVLPRADSSLPLVATPDGWALPVDREGVTVRTYTPRVWDAATGELTLDVALHANPGPASVWAQRAIPGDQIAIGGPGGGYDVDAAANPLIIVGDESALPALGTIRDAVHDAGPGAPRVRAIVEVPHPDDGLLLPGAHVLVRGSAEIGSLATDALRALAAEFADARIFLASEAGLIRRLRSWLLGELRLPPMSVVTRGYWKLGASNHPDHDYGND
jgi:NADPH-dependent ferric siderophore reductase